MKKMKKTAAMLMAATVAVAMPMTAMAASIEVSDAVVGEVYKAYKIFDYTKSGDNYSYTIEEGNLWKDVIENFKLEGSDTGFFTLTASKNHGDVYVVTTPWDATNNRYVEMTEDQAKEFAEYLKKNMSGKTSIPQDGAKADANGNVNFGDLEPGYYFVNTTTGSVCSLFNSDSTQQLREKNKLPNVNKKVKNAEGVASNETTASIGDIVTYEITVDDGKGTDKQITVHDKMSAGLELVNDVDHPITVLKNGTNSLTEGSDYVIKTGDDVSETSEKCTFEVELKDKLVDSLTENDKVVITYSAKITKEILDSRDGVTNSAKITYSNSEIDIPTPPVVYTYGFDLVKTNKNKKVLEGAEFKLYSEEAATNEIKVVEIKDVAGNGTGVYRVAEESEDGEVIKAGVTTIKGLGNGTYYLVETVAPQGFNPLTEATAVEIRDAYNSATFDDADETIYSEGGVQVINYTGTILPSTGGIGTTVFYAAGIVVMAGAVFFVVRSKKHE